MYEYFLGLDHIFHRQSLSLSSIVSMNTYFERCICWRQVVYCKQKIYQSKLEETEWWKYCLMKIVKIY
jgi:hypothetical protein